VAALTSCAGGLQVHAGNASTDRQAQTVALAISYPRQVSAEGFVRATNAVTAGKGIAVVQAEDLDAAEPEDPIARLVFSIYVPGSKDEFSTTEPFTACYEAQFNTWGVIGDPARVDCPVGATPIVPTPLAPKPNVVIPEGFDATLEKLLTGLPAVLTAGDVRGRVTGALPAPVVDSVTGLRDLAPTVETTVRGTDVGVSLWEGPGDGCLLGARVAGKVVVWRPSHIQLQPGELSCGPETALQLQGITAPH
jgi:hypothetical protein